MKASAAVQVPNTAIAAPRFLVRVYVILFVLGLALRWWRLDLIPFRFDAAEALARARDVLQLGYPPLTGIVNSLGFRNPAGLEWLLLPTAIFTPDPRIHVAWIGFLFMLGTWPLLRLGDLLAGRGGALLLGAIYVLHPTCVFASRDVWAQNILPALSSWALWWCVEASCLQPARRSALLSRALALLVFASAIHLSALAWWVLVAMLAGWSVRAIGANAPHAAVPSESERSSAVLNGKRFCLSLYRCRYLHLAIPVLVLILVMSPSAIDLWYTQTRPAAPKPDYVQAYERRMPKPKPLGLRVADSIGGLFQPLSSFGATGGAAELLSVGAGWGALVTDFILLLLTLGGMVLVLLRVVRIPVALWLPPSFAMLLCGWTVLPAVSAAVIMRYPNPTYLYCAIPAILLLAAVGVRDLGERLTLWRGRKTSVEPSSSASSPVIEADAHPICKPRTDSFASRIALVFAISTVVSYSIFHIDLVRQLDRTRRVNGPYYIPLCEQMALVREMAARGVRAGHFVHLSGGWYQRSYDYLFDWLAPASSELSRSQPIWGVAEDLAIRRHQPARIQWAERTLHHVRGTVCWTVIHDDSTLAQLMKQYNALPTD